MNNFKTRLKDRFDKCNVFFDKLCEVLANEYDVVNSPWTKDRYLVPKGTADQITYYTKPMSSFRVSDHWNWFAPTNKCDKQSMIQCYSVDLPFAHDRAGDKKSKGSYSRIDAAQVGFVCPDGKYRAVYGEIYDRKTKTWSWLEVSPEDVACMIPSSV